MSQTSSATRGRKADIGRIIKYAPAELIGREVETKLLADAWDQAARGEKKRLRVLTFVALGGEGKTSLVAKWAADLAHQDWPGCDAVFAWSFYSQGTREQNAASSDLFLAEALTFFGDAAMAGSAAGAFDKGRRLAQLAGERRSLLILDGLEPLQYAPTSPTPGELKDQGLAALLKGLAANNHGLCVVTTRYAIPDLRAFIGKTMREEKLTRLSTEAGVALLQSLGVKGSLRKNIPSADGRGLWNEFEKLVEDVKGHALTLNLLGSYLRDAHAGDIRQRDLIKLEEADAEEQGGHAFRVMDAYVQSFESGGKTAEDKTKGLRALALLQLLGLFDRPATADCLKALWQPPAIAGLTESLIGINEAQRNLSLKRLEDAKLLTANRAEGSGELIALDTHPLLREYFARRVRQHQPETWRAAHRRLYEHLTSSVIDLPKTLEAMEPLFQAMTHACASEYYQDALDLYWRRIQQNTDERMSFFAKTVLGAIPSCLSALSGFFLRSWDEPHKNLEIPAYLLIEIGFNLRASGRLKESLKPLESAINEAKKHEKWQFAASAAGSLSGAYLSLGKLTEAERYGDESAAFARRTGAKDEIARRLARFGQVLHQLGKIREALAAFDEAEKVIGEELLDLMSFRYCDLLLDIESRKSPSDPSNAEAIVARVMRACRNAEEERQLLAIGLNYIALSRALETVGQLTKARECAEESVTYLRQAGQLDDLPHGLLRQAVMRDEFRIGPESAQSDLDEAREIAERGPMKLFLADIHLYRARLFFREQPYPWQSPEDDLAAAEKLINDCGYHRRDGELADAKQALLGQALR